MTGGRESAWGASRRGAWMAAAVLAFCGAGVGFVARRESRHANAGDDLRTLMLAQADSLDTSLASLRDVLSTTTGAATHGPPVAVRQAFRRARAQYKHLEGVVEFYAPALAAAFNSRRQEVDDDDAPPPSLLAPSGFPALESLLWSSAPPAARSLADSARSLVDAMHPLVGRVRGLASGGGIHPTDAQVVELTRLELIRVTTLGIAGFDTPRSRDAMVECAEAIDGIRQIYVATAARWPGPAARKKRFDASLTAASGYLRQHTDFVDFDRLGFLTDYATPTAVALDSLRLTAGVVPLVMPRGLRASAASPYLADAFDARAYAPRSAPSATSALIALGERLFADPRLSGPGTRSCASCHDPSHTFTDGRATPASIGPRMRVPRNTPTLINVGLQPAQFADERAVSLEDQVVEVLRSRAEMASSIELASARVAADRDYRARFANAFGDEGGDGTSVTPLRVRQALAAYERSLIAMSSRFDRAVRGDTSAITGEERRGFNLFMGKAGCGSCHFAPLFGGVSPPLYVASDVEVIGTPARPGSNALDPDSGRGAIDHRADHVRAFKVPSLRNVALTAPYMHNGTFLTLRQVMDFYEAGGAQGGSRLPNQTLATDSLHLTPSERDAVIAFLQTLTDSSVRPDRVKIKVPDNHTSP